MSRPRGVRAAWRSARLGVWATGAGLLAAASMAADLPLCDGEAAFLADRVAITRRALEANPFTPGGLVRRQSVPLNDATLHGWRVMASDMAGAPVAPQGYLLVLPGDAMLAQDMVPLARRVAARGFDVFVLDHRGFGASTGTPSIARSIQDVHGLVAFLDDPQRSGLPPYGRRYLYAMSAGAALALNAVAAGLVVDGLVADGLPASLSHEVGFLFITLSRLACPPAVDPVNLVAGQLAVPLVLVFGGADRQLRATQVPAAQQRLAARACRAGASVVRIAEWGHPGQGDFREDRARLLGDYLVAGGVVPVGRRGVVTDWQAWGTATPSRTESACPADAQAPERRAGDSEASTGRR